MASKRKIRSLRMAKGNIFMSPGINMQREDLEVKMENF
jgi:hypothetical protein